MEIAESLSGRFSNDLRVADVDMANSAVTAAAPENYFNLSIEDAKRIGSAIGTDFFVLIRADIIRRSSSARPVFYESYCSAFLVSTRTGRLIRWRLVKHEEDTSDEARERLMLSVGPLASEFTELIRDSFLTETAPGATTGFDPVPDEDSPDAKGLRAPIPYRRIRPEYTTDAYFHNVRATVDIEADIDADGTIVRTDIVRWAGYGLDESVETAVRTMNWRPAERNGRTLPMRVLLRYNFTRIEKDGQP
jgi:hypothetical protein